jgi:ADP-ribose pyrophosphatase
LPFPPLPAPPRITIAVVRDRTAESRATGGFLNLRRVDLVAKYPNGEESAPFPYDLVTRKAIDAVVIAAHFVRGGERHVFLRSAVRPPLALRADPPPGVDPDLWELPAGLVEPGESFAVAAARELAEELGFVVPAASLVPMGGPTYPAPAFIAEQHVFFHVAVDPDLPRGPPTEDGSALERGASIVAIPLGAAIEHCRTGAIRDGKTEIALRRLAELG